MTRRSSGRADGQTDGRTDGGGPYALVVLTRGYGSREAAMAVLRDVAGMVHDEVLRVRNER